MKITRKPASRPRRQKPDAEDCLVKRAKPVHQDDGRMFTQINHLSSFSFWRGLYERKNDTKRKMEVQISWLFAALLIRPCLAYRFADHILDVDEATTDATAWDAASSWYLTAAMTPLADVPPPTVNRCYPDHWARWDDFLIRYWDENDGYEKTTTEHQQTYGEVTVLGARQLAYEMGIATLGCEAPYTCTSKVIFYDLGSGLGRLVTQIYFDQPCNIRKATGVELSLHRHGKAQQALDNIRNYEDLSDLETPLPIYYQQGDATQIDWSDGTHVFLSSLCFPDSVLESLQWAMLSTPHVKVVASLNRLNLLQKSDNWIERHVHIQMSWGPGTAKIYHRREAGLD